MKLPDYLRIEKKGSFLLDLWIQPGSRKTDWAGIHDGRIKIKLKAPPSQGRANKELIGFLAKQLALPIGDLELAHGASSRGKTVRIHNTTEDHLLSRLPCGDDPATEL